MQLEQRLVRLAMGVSAGWSPSCARRARYPAYLAGGARVDALRRPGPRARGRRRMGSVGGWPLAIPITVASGGNRDGGSPTGEASRTGPPPAGSPGRTQQLAHASPLVYAPVLLWGTWSGIADARQGTQRRLARPASPGALKQVTKSLRRP